MQHCKVTSALIWKPYQPLTSLQIITIGDCSKMEMRTFYLERILPRVPDNLKAGLDFERLYEAFGGRLVHWKDYVTDFGERALSSAAMDSY